MCTTEFSSKRVRRQCFNKHITIASKMLFGCNFLLLFLFIYKFYVQMNLLLFLFIFFLFFALKVNYLKIAIILQNKVKCGHQPSRLIGAGVSARPLTLSRSAVFRKAGNCSCETLTSPAYINSKMACRWVYETSFRMIIGCFDGFSCVQLISVIMALFDWHQIMFFNILITSNKDLKYGLHADNTILCALHVCPSHASVTYGTNVLIN